MGVVLELQRDALDRGVAVSDLLRKALVVARKLGIGDFEEWIGNELNGYGPKADVPRYRNVGGQVRAWNPVRGWIPVIFDEEVPALHQRDCHQSVAELEAIASRSKKGDMLVMPFPAELAAQISRPYFQTEVVLQVQVSSLLGILDAVRTVVLNWALKLEQDGIVGDGLTFSREEKKAASSVAYNVNNFYGNVGHSQIAQQGEQVVQIITGPDVDHGKTEAFLEELQAGLRELGLNADGIAEMRAEIDTIRSQLASPKPKGKIVREGLRSVQRILEGAAGAAAAPLVLKVAALLAAVAG